MRTETSYKINKVQYKLFDRPYRHGVILENKINVLTFDAYDRQVNN